MRYLYTILLYIATPFVLLRLLWRSRRAPGYRQRWPERFGHIPTSDRPSIWLHAVSLGETIAAAPLIKNLLAEYQQYPLVVTSTTPTGSAQVQKLFGGQVTHVYVPYDLPGAVKRFLKHSKPALGIIMETELWPNLLYYTHKRQIPTLLANARLSERSCQGYQKVASLVRNMLNTFSAVAAQSQLDGDRFIRLGLAKEKLLVTGNIKFDMELPDDIKQQAQALRNHWQDRPTWIAASTHDGEEDIILKAHAAIRQQFSNALLILVPRHPERFAKVAELIADKGMALVRRSLKQFPKADTSVFLGDTMGELRLFYGASDIAFVGGSLVPIGGHNLIEPAAFKVPVLSGPNLQNFVAIKELLMTAKALTIVNDSESLAKAVSYLLENQSAYQAQGEHAYDVSIANTGAVAKHMQWIGNRLC